MKNLVRKICLGTEFFLKAELPYFLKKQVEMPITLLVGAMGIAAGGYIFGHLAESESKPWREGLCTAQFSQQRLPVGFPSDLKQLKLVADSRKGICSAVANDGQTVEWKPLKLGG